MTQDLLLALNFQEPIGSANSDLAAGYNNLYLPFLNTLEKYEQIKANLRLSGVLCDWLDSSKPEFFDKLKFLVKRHQVEILTGGHYDPVLPLIPDPDKVDQIRCQTDFIKKRLGFIPRGMWLNDGEWEPGLPGALAAADIEYLFLDSSNFEEGALGYYITEDAGRMLKVYPSKGSINEILSSPSGGGAVVYSENIEKFDGEPGIEALFKKIVDSTDRFQTALFSDDVDSHDPSGRAYIKSTFDRRYLVRDDSANRLHKKMLYVSGKIDSVMRAHIIGAASESRTNTIKAAQKELWMGEGSAVYLDKKVEGRARAALYSHLIEAENLVDSMNKRSGNYADLSVTDFDKDGMSEALISTRLLNVYVSPKDGGSVFELDYRPKRRNLLAGPSFADRFLAQALKFLPVRNPNEVSVKLSGEGDISGTPVKIMKTISVFAGQSIVNVYYELENPGGEAASFPFEVGFDLSIAGEGEPEVFTGNKIKIIDAENGFSVSLDLSNEAEIVRRPGSSTAVSLSWKVDVPPKNKWTNKVSFLVEQ